MGWGGVQLSAAPRTEEETRLRVAGYGRVSTDEEKQLDSLAHQMQFFSEFADAQGHTLWRLYADEGISGKQLKKRDQFLRMLEDAERHLFDILVVKDVSRFARNTVDLLTAIRRLKALGIEVLFVNNNQKLLGESEFIITLLGAMAQEESANLSKRVKFGKLATSKKGRVPPRIFGYDRIDNFSLCINETEADTVRRIFSLYTEGEMGCRRIAATLGEEGRTTKTGCEWTAKSIRRILENPIYCGSFYNHKYQVVDFLEGRIEQLPPEKFFFHERPQWAILSPACFQQAQGLLRQRKKSEQGIAAAPAGRHSGAHLFSTLIRCASCGRTFYRRTVTYKNTYIYWSCSGRQTAHPCDNASILDEEELKRQLGGYFGELLFDQEQAAAMLLECCKKREADTGFSLKAPQSLEKRREKLRRQREKYRELYANELLSLAELKERLDRLDRALITLEASCVPAAEARLMGKLPSKEAARAEIQGFLALETVGNGELRRLVSHILVDGCGEVTIFLSGEEGP